MLIDILRHGQPDGGEVLRGRVDHPLSPAGWDQMYASTGLAADAATASPSPWSRVISSPLQRCRHFAEQFSARLGLPLAVDEQWQEINYGDWDGMPVSEWRKVAADQFRAFRQDMTALAPPGGEDFMSFRDRVLRAWDGILALPEPSHVLLVTHGGVMRVILPTVLGIPLNHTGVLHIPFACLSRIEVTRQGDRQQAALVFHNGRLTADT